MVFGGVVWFVEERQTKQKRFFVDGKQVEVIFEVVSGYQKVFVVFKNKTREERINISLKKKKERVEQVGLRAL